jgi:hypothetical protein
LCQEGPLFASYSCADGGIVVMGVAAAAEMDQNKPEPR